MKLGRSLKNIKHLDFDISYPGSRSNPFAEILRKILDLFSRSKLGTIFTSEEKV